jgi:hypothetical protein
MQQKKDQYRFFLFHTVHTHTYTQTLQPRTGILLLLVATTWYQITTFWCICSLHTSSDSGERERERECVCVCVCVFLQHPALDTSRKHYCCICNFGQQNLIIMQCWSKASKETDSEHTIGQLEVNCITSMLFHSPPTLISQTYEHIGMVLMLILLFWGEIMFHQNIR